MKIFDKLLQHGNKIAFIYNEQKYDYGWLYNEVQQCIRLLNDIVNPGDIVQLCSDYNPKAIAVFIALAYKRAIIAPLTNVSNSALQQYNIITKPQVRITISEAQDMHCEHFQQINDHAYVKQLHTVKPGLKRDHSIKTKCQITRS